MKAMFRGLRDDNGQPIFQPSLTAGTPGTLYGESILYPSNGAWDAEQALAGDTSAAILAVRQDISYKILTEAVISDADGQGHPQPRAAGRGGHARRDAGRVPGGQPHQPPGTGATRFPFAVLAPAALTRWASLTVAELREHGTSLPDTALERILAGCELAIAQWAGPLDFDEDGRSSSRRDRLGARADAPAPAPGADRGVVRRGHPPWRRDRARPDGYRVEERYLRRLAMALWGEWTRVTHTPLDDSAVRSHRACPAGPAGAERPARDGQPRCGPVVRGPTASTSASATSCCGRSAPRTRPCRARSPTPPRWPAMRYRTRVAIQAPVEVRDPAGGVSHAYETIPTSTRSRRPWCRRSRSRDGPGHGRGPLRDRARRAPPRGAARDGRARRARRLRHRPGRADARARETVLVAQRVAI